MKKQIALSIALAASLHVGGVRGEDNIGDVRRSVEEKGGKVYWGKHLDHAEYATCAAAIATGTLPAYLENLGMDLARDLGTRVGSDLILRALKGESVGLGKTEIQGGISSYNHWRVIKYHFFRKWQWRLITEEIALPNTHQVYLRIKQK